MSDLAASVGAGLLDRFRRAGAEIAWREQVPVGKARRRKEPADRVRIAHLHDEEARVLDRTDGSLVVDSGPVGALVLLLEIDRRGAPSSLRAQDAGAVPGFGQGALEAGWGAVVAEPSPALPVADIVALARYALV
jgi:hypothetical protein